MNLRKIFKNGICVTLLSAILFCSPVSRYMDTQQITKAEAASLEFTGVTLFYAFAQLLGYEVATTNTSMLIDEFVKFSTASQNEIASKVVETATHGLYSPDDSIEQAVLKGFISLLSEFMISASYESVDGYNDSFSERSAQISFTYAPASPSGYYYNRMPATARTALWSKFLKTMKSGLYSSDVEFLGYFSLYSEREDCFYYTDYGFNSSTDGSYKEFVLFSDGLYLVSFDCDGYITDYSIPMFEKYVVDLNTWLNFKGISGSTLYGNDDLFCKYLYDNTYGNPFQISSDFISLKPLRISKDVFVSSQIPKNYTGLSAQQNQGYASPSTESLTIINHGIVNHQVIDSLSNVESVSVSSLAQIADAYDGTISDSYSWGLTDTFPAADVTETEDKVIADIFPVTDTIAGDLTDTGIKDDTVTGDGTGTSTKDDTITDSGTDTGTDSGIISLWDTLWGWLKKILNALFDIVSALLNLANDIAEAILDPLIESLADLLKTLFVPDMTAFESQLSLISAKFAWISTLFNSIKSIRGFIASSASSIPPSIYMNFSSAESSKYNSIGNVAFIDASWYAPYKSNGDAILSAFLWFAFIWRLFKKIPSVLNGLSMTSDKDID